MPTLNFKGKSFVYNHHLAVKYHQLVPKPELSLTDNVSLHDNLIIHGDNLNALKALLPTYAGKVKCIYIDPPYNTRNEGWIYSDNVNSPVIKEWIGKVVDKEDLTRHDKWLCMMMPRLKILKELLTDDGILFVSIDDNEVHNLKLLLEEIFEEEHFIGCITWIKRTKPINSGKARFQLQQKVEYILVYSKVINSSFEGFKLRKVGKREYNDIGKLGKCRLIDIEDSDYGGKARDTMKFSILGIKPEKGKRWKIGKDEAKRLRDNNRIEKVDGKIKVAVYPEDEEEDILAPFWSHFNSQEVGTAETGKATLTKILGEGHGFDTVKPVELMKKIIYASTSQNDIILDSFAGSGTTAQSVLDLNQLDGGNRKFILVEMEDYANKITAERVRRVIKGIPKEDELDLSTGTGGTFSYFELGEPIEMESILQGKNLPNYNDLARYVFYTATGEQFNPKKVNEKKNIIGETKDYEVYLFYKPDIEYLRNTALTLKLAESLGKHNGKKRLVFAPAKYVDTHTLLNLKIEYCQLPFEIYRIKE